MTGAQVLITRFSPAEQTLHRRLRELRDAGQPPPCQGSDLWISELAADRHIAADLCLDCSAFGACHEAAMDIRPRHGVWAGVEYLHNRDGER